MKLNLHRSGEVPEWETVDADKRNWAQKLAAKTGVTPAHVITLAGCAIRLTAAYKLAEADKMTRKQRALWLGVSAMGNFCDMVDGIVATKLGVRCPAGKKLDIACDGVAQIAEVIGFRMGGIIETRDAATVAGIKLSNIAAAARGGDYDSAEVQASEAGKKFTGLAALTGALRGVVSLLPESDTQDSSHGLVRVVEALPDAALAATAFTGLHATHDYWSQAA